MTQDEISALLGRPLSAVEVTNFDLYLDIAVKYLESLICTPLAERSEERIFDTREGYQTAFVDIFNELTEVKIDDEVVEADTYSVRQWDKRNGSWYNSIVFDDKFESDGEVAVTADWGFGTSSGEESDIPTTLPSDLKLLLAGLFDLLTKQNRLDREINSKKVEDFTVTFNHSSITMNETLAQSFAKDHAAALARYSLCAIGNLQHGRVRRGRHFSR